ncbi:MAG: cyclic nucleotide-binding domain-containing protein [Alphaproteobacteria bacterium]|nr:cyclic nucleotide-binding domain-containing protein [Alphaproteobacteria bacterium]
MITALPPIFAGLEPDDQAQARAMLQPFRFEPGEIVMAQGEDDASVAFITNGSAEILVEDSRVGTAGPREIIGEMELFGSCPRLATARAINALDLLVLGPDQYVELCETGNPVVYRLEQQALRRVGDRLRQMDEAIAQMSDGEPFVLHPKGKSLLSRLNPFARDKGPNLDKTDVLSRSTLFSWAQANLLDELSTNFTTAAYGNDHRICVQGEVGDTMYIIADGQVDIVLQVAEDRAERIATLGPGMAFGDSAIMHACPRTATCVAKGDVQVLVMDRDHFMAIVDTFTLSASVFRQALIKNLVMQIDKADQRYVFLDRQRAQVEEEMYKGTPVSSVWRD